MVADGGREVTPLETGIDFNKAVELPSGVRVLNCTPHRVVFTDGRGDIVVNASGAKLSAQATEEVVERRGDAVEIVRTVFSPTESGLSELEQIRAHDPSLLVLGSIISAQAYAGEVLGMTPAPGFERVAVEDKRMNPNKFIQYPSPNV